MEITRKHRYETGSHDAVDNAFKTLAVNLGFSFSTKQLHSIAIVSSIPSEGKTTITQGLGEALASDGKKVLLVECDLHRRSLATRLGVHGKNGLYALVTGKASIDECVIPTNIDGMSFLDAEPNVTNPSAMLQSEQFKKTIDDLDERYDYVIIDTPPVTTFVDASLIASIADATLLVVRQGFVHRNEVTDAYEQLKNANANVIGVVMNCVPATSSGRYYGYYKHYEHQDEHDTTKKAKSETESHSTDASDEKPSGKHMAGI